MAPGGKGGSATAMGFEGIGVGEGGDDCSDSGDAVSCRMRRLSLAIYAVLGIMSSMEARSDTNQKLNLAPKGEFNCKIMHDSSINSQIDVPNLVELFGENENYFRENVTVDCNGTAFSAEMSGSRKPRNAQDTFTWNWVLRGDYFDIYKSDKYIGFAMNNDRAELGSLSKRVRLCAKDAIYSESSRFIHVKNCNIKYGSQIEIKIADSLPKKYPICVISAMNEQARINIYMSGTTAICEGDTATLASFLSAIGANLGFDLND